MAKLNATKLRARGFDLLRFQGGHCFYCQSPILGTADYTMDHIVPLSHGGPDNQFNIVVSCYSCNELFGNASAKMKILWMLRHRPNKPNKERYVD